LATSFFSGTEGHDELRGQVDGLLVFDQQAQALRETHDKTWADTSGKLDFGKLDALACEATGRLSSGGSLLRHPANLTRRDRPGHGANFATLTLRRHWDGILNYYHHYATSALIESI
jgi:hypothetical protein